MSTIWGMADDPSFKPDAVLDMTQTPAAQGAMCALLTPAIKGELQQMSDGQIRFLGLVSFVAGVAMLLAFWS